ncbi:MAG: ChbG/HpnK family deacetylase [Elusimicrobiota bacterium]|nr:ChbG/HpnK family deacetylase [Elusimicrobiota bacterium]
MQFFYNADDYGLSKQSTESINKCIDMGLIDAISLMCGGKDICNAFDVLKNKYAKSVIITVHLNLFDGKCSAKKEDVSSLSDGGGFFKLNLFKLWYAVNISRKKEEIKNQIFIEFCAQIDFFILHFPKMPIRIDGHQHIHAMPALLDVIEKLINKYQISYVRTPIENNYKFQTSPVKKLKGLFRRYLLKKWGLSLKSLLEKYKIKTSDYFIGSALSCDMNYEYLDYVYKKISDKKGLAEIMLHPWSANEFNLIMSKDFQRLKNCE